MPNTDIQVSAQGGGALSAEHYQTFEMAKANDTIIGGDDVAQIRSYAAFARAQAQAIHKSIATMGELEDVAQAKAEMTETSQTFAKVSVYADQRIGEILRELPKAKGNQYQQSAEVGTPTKAQTIKQANIDHHTAIDLQAMAANPEVVEAVIAKAEAEGRIVSRNQVLDAIREKKLAEQERDTAKSNLAEAYRENEMLDAQVASLKRQVAERPEPEVVEKVVEVVPESTKRRLAELEQRDKMRADDNRRLREQLKTSNSELEKAREILGTSENIRDVRRDVQYLTTATNSYVRQYGGLTWTVQQLAEVDEPTLEQFRKAVTNLATFSNALVTSLGEMNG